MLFLPIPLPLGCSPLGAYGTARSPAICPLRSARRAYKLSSYPQVSRYKTFAPLNLLHPVPVVLAYTRCTGHVSANSRVRRNWGNNHAKSILNRLESLSSPSRSR